MWNLDLVENDSQATSYLKLWTSLIANCEKPRRVAQEMNADLKSYDTISYSTLLNELLHFKDKLACYPLSPSS